MLEAAAARPGSPAPVEGAAVSRTEVREEGWERGDSVLRARPALRRVAPVVGARRAVAQVSAVARTVVGEDRPERGDSGLRAQLALRRVAPVVGARAAGAGAAEAGRWI